MIIVLDNTINAEDRKNLRAFLEKNHFHVNEIVGEEETIFGAVGKMVIDPREVEVLPGVKRVIPISKPYKMASREFKKDNTVVEVPNNRGQVVRVGGRQVVAIAGPCAVESREQMISVARRVALSGAVMLRGGAFKPRTSPYAFQGLGEEGIKLLKEAGNAFGLPVVTEIVSSEHIPLMIDYVDVYQVGARNMQNFELLKRLGALGKPVILKRGLSATIEEWLMSAEYLLSSGTDRIILCERGIRTYEKATRNTLDLSAIPVLRQLTHLPIIVDPSHAVGVRDKVPPMALAAIAAGADGIIVEAHCDPDKALSDGPQALYPEQFDKLMRDIDVLAPVVGREVFRLRKTGELIQELTTKTTKDTKTTSSPFRGFGQVVCAYTGTKGAFAEQAIGRYFGSGNDGAGTVQELATASFREIFQAVTDGRADYGMVPIENSLAGSVYDNYDNLLRFDTVQIVGALTMRIEHSLLALPGATIEGIKNVYSHPHGFPQCADFLEAQRALHRNWRLIDALSTASAAELVAERGALENAAIASGVAGEAFGLVELVQGIESNTRNYTRFVIIAPFDAVRQGGQAEQIPMHGCAKVSVIFATRNAPGALYDCLGVFHKRGLNLSRLESRPVPGEPWRYMFYADIAADNDTGGQLDAIIRELGEKADSVRLLGLYQEMEA